MKQAEFSVTPMISDHAVLQREEPVVVRGRGKAGSEAAAWLYRKTNELKPQSGDGIMRRAGVREDGTWRVKFPPLPAGGPYELAVTCGGHRVVFTDIYMGDVWILAGQSNMQLPMERVKYRFPQEYRSGDSPLIRQFAVPVHWNFDEKEKELSGGHWIKAAPESVAAFSAVGFFFARALFERYRVPVGLLLTAVGGTPIQAWMAGDTLKGYPDLEKEAETYRRNDKVRRIRRDGAKRTADWWKRLNLNDRGIKEHWETGLPDCGWKRFSPERPWGDTPGLSGCGTVWLRKYITVAKARAGKRARLSLGTVTDADVTYVNGAPAGRTDYQYPPREYLLDGLAEGINVIVMRLAAVHGTGGFTAGKKRGILWDDGFCLELSRDWEYRRGAVMEPLEEQTFFERTPVGMYQAMIAPLHDFSVRGVCWYQGESNAGEYFNYGEYFERMVKDWRKKWNKKNLPFLFVQLPNYDLGDAGDWVNFREAQRGLLSVPDTAMAVTIDCGETNDLHPSDKKTVGIRLAMAAFRMAYGEKGDWLSPVFAAAVRRGNELVLSFGNAEGGMKTSDGDIPKELFFRYADGKRCAAAARIDGSVIKAEIPQCLREEPESVEYACSNAPENANLCNGKGLPASPFTCVFPRFQTKGINHTGQR